MSLLDELRTTWPPGEDPPEGGYLRRSLATATPVAATTLRAHGAHGPGVVLARDPAGRLLLAPLVREGPVWRRARPRDGASVALLDALAGGEPLDDGFQLRRLGEFSHARGERAIGVDQTNESVVVGGSVVVKWLAEPALRSPEVGDLQAHLAAVGYMGVPRPLGSLSWTDAAGMQAPLAQFTEWLPDARDGWDWCVQDLLEHLGHLPGPCASGCAGLAFPSALGRMTAGLHVALATPSTVIEEPCSRVDPGTLRAWVDTTLQAVDTALELLSGDALAELTARADVLRARITSLGDVAATSVQRIHGDLHVGQVLGSPRGLAVIDLDDDISIDAADRGRPLPAARDVAQMSCSLDHVGRIAARRTAADSGAAIERWIEDAQRDFLDAYRSALREAGRPELLDERALAPLTAERICRELIYAATVLPRWLYAPLGTLRRFIA